MKKKDNKKTKRKGTSSSSYMPIAVIGISCRFPGAKDYHQYWNNLIEGVDSISEIPADRWDWHEYYGDPKTEINKTNIKWGGFISDIDKFDCKFFRMSPKEATYSDPQHRIFLEAAWHAIEDAGYSTHSLNGKKIGVYVGVSKNDYSELMREHHDEIVSFVSTGTVHSILPNRVSFLLNFKGASESIDTACSSALVALHNAIRSIQSGECELAIVGGVNALISPTMYISHSKSGMLSNTGKCRTFDQSADGYVRGEGVGVIVLKPLDKAIADHDNIRAVIRGDAVNHGGHSNFLTSPSVQSQADVIVDALKKSNIDPETVSYIEAHGTATPLGDPIEINGLKTAYTTLGAEKRNYCGIGSVKPNIGHLESASGVASLIKVILAMENASIPPSINFTKLNENISLQDSPFFIVDKKVTWENFKGKKRIPKRAGISSFGMGGVNAHILLEEAPPITPSSAKYLATRFLFILSAKQGRLKDYVASFAKYIANNVNRMDQNTLNNISYTLQTGRDEFEERIAIIAHSAKDLYIKLTHFTNDEQANNYYYNILDPKATLIKKELVIKDSNLENLADAWTKGSSINWMDLYKKYLPYKVSLPCYPFERKRLWIMDTLAQQSEANLTADIKDFTKHDLKKNKVERNLSTRDHFIRDHIVKEKHVLPGVMYLELAREAGLLSKLLPSNYSTLTFKDIYWQEMMVVDNKDLTNINLELNGEMKFSIETVQKINCLGKYSWTDAVTTQSVDLNAILHRCKNTVKKDKLYETFIQGGLKYGDTFQVIKNFHYLDKEAISLIELRENTSTKKLNKGYLDPSLMDGAFQTAAGLTLFSDTEKKGQFVPYYAKEVNVYGPLTAKCYAITRLVEGDGKKNFLKFDIMIVDEKGKVLVDIKEFTKKLFVSHAEKQITASNQVEIDNFYYKLIWKPIPKIHDIKNTQNKNLLIFDNSASILHGIKKSSVHFHKIIQIKEGEKFSISDSSDLTIIYFNKLVADDYKKIFDYMKVKNLSIDYVIYAYQLHHNLHFPYNIKNLKHELDNLSKGVLALTQELIKSKAYSHVRLLCLYPINQDEINLVAPILAGFSRTLRYENPNLQYVTMGIDDYHNKDITTYLLQELTLAEHIKFNEVRYIKTIRAQKVAENIESLAQPKNSTIFKKNGTYLMTGGAGGLGRIFALYLARTYQAKIVLLGRSKINSGIEKIQQEISQSGGTSHYFSVDVTDDKTLNQIFESNKKLFHELNGVIHAAGIIADNFILRKSAESFRDVLQTKIVGAVNLDNITQHLNLDFFLMCSSIAALLPNQGQSDYAGANSFLDEFASMRDQLVKNKKRHGATLSLNWPLWAEGGMSVTKEEEEYLLNVFGMKAITKDEGVKILEKCLWYAANKRDIAALPQIFVMNGDSKKIHDQLDIRPEVNDEPVEVKVENIVAGICARELNVFDSDLNLDLSFEELGIDSLSMLKIVEHINYQLKLEINPTLFFEVTTIRQLIDNILGKHEDYLNNLSVYPFYDRPTPKYSLISYDISEDNNHKYIQYFDSHDFYMRDHIVNEKYNVPGACYIEMARQAAEIAGNGKRVYKLLNNYWPKQFSTSKEIITAYVSIATKDGETLYEISSKNSEGNTELHGVGQIVYDNVKTIEMEQLDIASIRSRCPHSQNREQVYKQIIAEGLHVGSTLMPMHEIYLNEDETLAKFKIPDEIKETLPHYVLHPSLLTGVYQAALISNRSINHDDLFYIPVGIDELEIMEAFPAEYYVYTRAAKKNTNASAFKKYDIDVCKTNGQVIIKLKGFSIKGWRIQAENQLEGRKEVVITKSAAETVNTDLKSCIDYIKNIIAPIVGMSSNEIDPSTAFENFGINSIMIVELNGQLEKIFGSLSKTLFFEYSNVNELADYFYKNHKDKLDRLIGIPSLKPAETNFLPKVETKPTLTVDQAVTDVPVLMSQPQVISRDIAIIGVSGMYPMAKNLQEFWENLVAGKDCITEIPIERFDYRKFYDADKEAEKIYSRWGSFIDDVGQFDAGFFNVTPKAAELMDPQERLFLEVAWNTIEDAGYTKESFTSVSRKVGVFVGALWQPYTLIGSDLSQQGQLIGPSGLLYSIANRVSYYFDFHGPSLTVDTACSSSLTALHLACESLRNGEIKYAIAGGVNLSLHPSKFLFLSQNRFLSTDGRCRSFGMGGDGYVPGEGIGAVLLKPLQQAIMDKDHIYGVIKGTSINHGGKTNGFTVPNPNAQASLIEDTFRVSGVEPDTISYLEAHGTGTSLGDPIEITALNKAYGMDNAHSCAIGSLKSNIGHLEAAAGIASLTKVLLQLEHSQLVPSIHSEDLNPNINWEETIFKVQRNLSPWTRPQVIENNKPLEVLRRAGISSFGAGGSNSHVIVEEAPTPVKAPSTKKTSYLITLSAKTEYSLRQKFKDLQTWLQKKAGAPVELEDISYTLNACRTHFDKRSAFVVDSVAELLETLDSFNKGNLTIKMNVGSSQREPIFDELLEKIFDDITGKTLDSAKYRTKLGVLGELYIKGYDINWQALHHGEAKAKIPLPTYPFVYERYWLPEVQVKKLSSARKKLLHPLIDKNISTLTQISFSKLLHADEFYLADHRVNNTPILPGVAYIEMARAATAIASPNQKVIGLQNITWAHPIKVTDRPIKASVNLYPATGGVNFSVTTVTDKSVATHAQGKIILGDNDREPAQISDSIDVIKNRCTKLIATEELYNHFKVLGFDYGASNIVIKHLNVNETEGLAEIELPLHLTTTANQYVLHPSLLDGVLQAALALFTIGNNEAKTYLPFSMGEILLYAAIPEHCYAHIIKDASKDAAKFQIQLRDINDNVLIEIKDFIIRSLDKSDNKVYDYSPIWEKESLVQSTDDLIDPILVFDDKGEFAENLRTKYPNKLILRISSAGLYQAINDKDYRINANSATDYRQLLDDTIARYGWPKQILYIKTDTNVELTDAAIEGQLQKTYYAIFHLSQALIKKSPKESLTISYVNMCQDSRSELFTEALSGFSKTLHLEYPKITCRIVTTASIDNALNELHGNEIEVRYDKQGTRFVRHYRQVALEKNTTITKEPFRKNGTYLITGGAGGLGLIFARYLAEHYQAKLILLGRSELSHEKLKIITELEAMGAEILYARIDITNKENLSTFINQDVKRRFKEINGVIHAAGVLRDAIILKKTSQDSADVLGPKIFGAVHLDELTQSEPLDFFVLFSSITATLGNVGQCDYAYANGFLDGFAEYRKKLEALTLRKGKTVAINWALWSKGGMQVNEATALQLKQIMGMTALETKDGIQAFINVLQQDYPDQIILSGQKQKLDRSLDASHFLLKEKTVKPKQQLTSQSTLNERLKEDLVNLISSLLKIKTENLNVTTDLMEYGIDSINMTNIANRLNKDYALDVRTAILFEYKSIAELSNYLVETYKPALEKYYLQTINIDVDDKIARRAKQGTSKIIRKATSANESQVKSVNSDISLRDQLTNNIVTIITNVLKIKPENINIKTDLMEYGVESINMTAIVNRLNQEYGLELSTAILFEYKSVEDLADYIHTNYARQVEKYHDSDEITSTSLAIEKPQIKPLSTPQVKVEASIPVNQYPVSFVQEQLWMASQIDSDSSVYNLCVTVDINGKLDTSILEQSIAEVINKQDILRTYFKLDNEKLVQCVVPNIPFSLKVMDLRASDQEDKKDTLHIFQTMKLREAKKPFDLNKAPLIRFALFQLEDENFVLEIIMHHIVLDGPSLVLMIQDITKIYEALIQGNLPSLPPINLHYRDYAKTLKERESIELINKDIDYWKEQLKGANPELSLPLDKVRPSVPSFSGEIVDIELDKSLIDAITRHLAQQKVTMYMFMIAALNAFFYRYTQQDDISIGCGSAYKPNEKLNDVYGCFMNVLVMRAKINKNESFNELLQQAKKITVEAIRHQTAPFEKVVEALKPRREINRTPLFEVLFLYQNIASTATQFAGLDLSDIVEIERGITRHSLVITLNKAQDGGFKGSFNFSKDIFERETIVRMVTHFKQMLQSIITSSDQPLYQLNLMPEDEIKDLVAVNPSPNTIFKPVINLFEEIALLKSKEIAFSSLETQLTYHELNTKANQLAHLLKQKGIKAGDYVGISLERTEKIVISILAILKCGAAFLSLDPNYPKERLAYILSNTNVAALITESSFILPENNTTRNVLLLDQADVLTALATLSEENLNESITPESTAYVIYTSGSTGLPKGVKISHANLFNYGVNMTQALGIHLDDRYLHTASFSFSSSVRQLILPLINGSRIVFSTKEQIQDPLSLFKFIKDQGVTVIDIVPSYWRTCIETLTNIEKTDRDELLKNDLRLICTASEPLYADIPNRWIQEITASTDLINMFGQTETTGITCTNHYYKANSMQTVATGSNNIVSLGSPIPGTKIYILDANMQLVPKGVIGEIYVGGPTIGMGYLNKPELTDKQFVPNPFLPQGRLFKTGDLGELGHDGSLEFIGRKDYQVKIRGFRVELGEIEAIMKDNPKLQDAIVVAREDQPGDIKVVAYWIPADLLDVPESSELREYAKNRLPDYMVPAIFVKMDEFPLTPSGKIDRKSLPPPVIAARQFAAPRDALEHSVADIWKRILKLEQISIVDNFFDLGGNSLSAIQLISVINKELEVTLSPTSIFSSPTIETMADTLRKQNKSFFESPLVPMQPAGNKPPIFAFHAVGGNVFSYTVLAQMLGKDQPFYGLQQAKLAPEDYTLEKMAACYISAIKEVAPKGPYHLVGWCIGGILAHEVAYQLEQQGETVTQVLVMDTYLPEYLDEPDTVNDIDLIIRFAWDLSGRYGVFIDLPRNELENITNEARFALLSERAKQAGLLAMSSSIDEIQELFTTYKLNLGASKNHKPKVIKSPIIYFNATLFKLGDNFFPEEEIGKYQKIAGKNIQDWSILTSSKFNTKDLNSSHYSMLAMPEIEPLIKELKDILNKS